MKPTIVYILGVGHSGTTILQYLLASGRGTLGLGEVRKLADNSDWERETEACSCGVDVGACAVWSDLKPAPGESKAAWYRRVADTLSHRYPNVTHWIDSSKTPGGLQTWLELHRDGIVGDIRLLFLVRNVHGWVVSDERTRRRKNWPRRPTLMPILSWWRAQAGIEKFLAAGGLDYRVVYYEGMIFRTQKVMEEIADYTGIERSELDWEAGLRHGEVHDVFGNRVKNDLARRGRLTYEDDWQYRPWLSLLTLIVWPAWRMNARLRNHALGTRS